MTWGKNKGVAAAVPPRKRRRETDEGGMGFMGAKGWTDNSQRARRLFQAIAPGGRCPVRGSRWSGSDPDAAAVAASFPQRPPPADLFPPLIRREPRPPGVARH